MYMSESNPLIFPSMVIIYFLFSKATPHLRDLNPVNSAAKQNLKGTTLIIVKAYYLP